MRSRRRPPGWLVNLGLAASAIVATLLFAEAAVRLLSPIGPALLVTDAGVGKRFRPGFSGPVYVDEARRTVAVHVNSAGFLGREWPRERPPGGLRLAVLGDSMTAGIGVDEPLRYTSRLETALAAERPGRAVDVLSFGVSSASTANALQTWRSVARVYRPDVVLLAFFAGNDLADNSARLTRADRPYFDLDEEGRLVLGDEPGPTPGLVRWLDLHSRLYVWQKYALRRVRGGARAAAAGIEPGQRIFATNGGPDVEHAWRVTRALVGALRGEVEANGGHLGLLLVPCAEQIDDALWADLQQRGSRTGLVLSRDEPSRRLAALAAAEGTPFCDLTSPLLAAARAGGGGASSADLYLLGRFHFSVEGHRVAAEAITAFLGGPGSALLAPDRTASEARLVLGAPSR